MKTPDLIRLKRDAGTLPSAALREFIDGVAHNLVDDAQLGAFLMAVYLRGLDEREQADLTLAMRDSGETLQWRGLSGPVLDKHSTGGVGDLVSLVLAPLLAACGAYVPMISGRGLGHTGGTLDKLESIPGFRVNLPPDLLDRCVRETGLAMVGQGASLAPADRRLYATRDVTATVSCQPLIVASILSKKLAEGLDGLVMDIKTGNGAIMKDEADAVALGQAIVNVAQAAGLPCTALLTDMDQPLASSAGNALELREAMRLLGGETGNPRLREVIFALCRELLATGGIEQDAERAQRLLEDALTSGAAADRFSRMVALQGGPLDLLEHPDRHLPLAPVRINVPSAQTGFLASVDTRALGRLVVALGGGRVRAEDPVDASVGLSGLPQIGEYREAGEPLLTVHAATRDDAETAVKRCQHAFTLEDRPPRRLRPAVHRRLHADKPLDSAR